MREMMAKLKAEAEQRVALEQEVDHLKAQLAEKEAQHEKDLAVCRAKSNELMVEVMAKVRAAHVGMFCPQY